MRVKTNSFMCMMFTIMQEIKEIYYGIYLPIFLLIYLYFVFNVIFINENMFLCSLQYIFDFCFYLKCTSVIYNFIEFTSIKFTSNK